MKPDAHKKKASQAYKKKHGITTEKKPATDAGRGRDRGGKDQASGGEGSSGREASKQAPGKSNLPAATSLGEGSTGTDAQPFQFEGKTFRRRQVQSNWTRYEGLNEGEDEDHITHRGADFNLLLNVATNSLSQFRFSDEKDWDEAVNESSTALAIDCVSVASALRCLPLDLQLGISQDYFTPDQLELFKQSAKMHLKSYNEQRKTPKATSQEESIDIGIWDHDTLEENESFDIVPNETPPPAHQVHTTKTTTTDVKSGEGKDLTNVETKDSASDPVKNTGKLEKNEEQRNPMGDVKSEEAQVAATEDDLDMLLGLDAPLKEPTQDEGQEELLPDIQEHSESVAESSHKAESPVPTVSVPSSTTNLEDWLDDLLDD